MGRMHSFGKGQAASMRPFTVTVPTHLGKTVGEIEQIVLAAAKRGIQPSHIGKTLRDSHEIGSAEMVLGCSLLQFLKKHGAEATFPEDLAALMEKAAQIRLHLSVHKKDTDARYRLNLVNSRLHRLLRYHKAKGNVPKTFKPPKN
ncbi:RS13 [Enterospora canceri]|uniref:RS13 n=1 Tax=Enterospora canceri TaxID=1081671 RepID=A0A1Y1S3Z5_9MICR|nr:RS13 [Enterospora canceri]